MFSQALTRVSALPGNEQLDMAMHLTCLNSVQKGQRVAVMKQHVCEVKYHDPHDDSD